MFINKTTYRLTKELKIKACVRYFLSKFISHEMIALQKL